MIDDMGMKFIHMIGAMSVILLISGFVGFNNISFKSDVTEKKKWLIPVVVGAIGGIFGIYGNITGFELDGAVISVRDIGPMFAGYIGGPLGGLIAGLIAGIHRLIMGGITAQACIIATCCIGLICGAVSIKWHSFIEKPYFALLFGALMEALHLGIVLLMVKPFETALDIVGKIAAPFITINSIGFMMLVLIISYIRKKRKDELEMSRLQTELEVAKVIQNSLLPLLNEDYPGCKGIELSASMEAAKEVGGDFYDVFYVDPEHLAFVIGDVSGKGIPAALFMSLSKITLQNCIRDIPKLSDAVATANNALCARNEADMFVTVWVGILDLTNGKLSFVSAGHNPPVLLRNEKPGFLDFKNGFVLAGIEGMTYKEHSVQLEAGDLLYLYTDGVTEAEDKEHNLFGNERLLCCFENKSGCGPAEIIENVKVSIDSFINGNSRFDDMTMLCFKLKNKDLTKNNL